MSASWSIGGLDLAALDRFAGALALVLRPGDIVGLKGELGAGKTTFARQLIAHIAGGEPEEVLSPTFALVQGYDTARMRVTHVDCYRLRDAADAEELGLAEALGEGLLVIEWPERIESDLPADRLIITLSEEDSETRRLQLDGLGGWSPRLKRLRAMCEFLGRSDWSKAEFLYLQGDASARRYGRLLRNGERTVLMDSPRQPDGPPIRDGKPYSAIAHLAEDVQPYVAVAQALQQHGLSTPKIFACDLDNGFVLIEDLGDRLYAREAAQGAELAPMYRAAVNVLLQLCGVRPPSTLPVAQGRQHRLPDYDSGALGIESELLLDWFWPAAHRTLPPQQARDEFKALWAEQFEALMQAEQGWVLRDFHSPNLMWLPERSGLAQVGILDFQDALRGPPAYDVVSLLQDARIDLPEALEGTLLDHYCARSGVNDSSFDKARFLAAYAILGAQRNTKILGIFARLAKRDGKRAYLAHIPRISAYLERDLAHPDLARLKAWYDRHLPPELRARPLPV